MSSAEVLERTEPITQDEFDEQFEQITVALGKLFQEAEDTPQVIDLQADRVEALKNKIHQMIEKLLEHPEASMRAEFNLLSRLYERRTRYSEHDKVRYAEFVTRTSDGHGIDHRFRAVTFRNGETVISDTTHFNNSLDTYCRFELGSGDLRTFRGRYASGITTDVEITDTTQKREYMYRFFYDTITAAALMMERHPDEAEKADREALAYLLTT